MTAMKSFDPAEFVPASLAFSDIARVLTTDDDDLDRVLAKAEAGLDEAEARWDASIARLKDSVNRMKAARAAGRGSELDQPIELAELVEGIIREDYRGSIEMLRRLHNMLHRLNPGAARALAPFITRCERAGARYVARLQDLRWEIMALRAEMNKDDRGPVFSDPKELKAYLARIGADAPRSG